MTKLIANIFLASLLFTCSKIRDTALYENQIQVSRTDGESLYFTMQSVGLNGNHNSLIISQDKDVRMRFVEAKGVERMFYRSQGDTVFLKLEHRISFDNLDLHGWTIIQDTYNGAELQDLLNDYQYLGYGLLD